jgi:hypothetical protein
MGRITVEISHAAPLSVMVDSKVVEVTVVMEGMPYGVAQRWHKMAACA